MGAFHDLFQPLREAILAARLFDYTPADMSAGILSAGWQDVMKGDFSRLRENRRKGCSGVCMQQGRVLLDSD